MHPRPIDVDVLLLGEFEFRSERLTLPHPEVTRRRFVLEPLLELDPGMRLPDGTPLRTPSSALRTSGFGSSGRSDPPSGGFPPPRRFPGEDSGATVEVWRKRPS